ncbi:MAG: hypothetical protein F4Y01_11620 [Gammaproteobacteria bacterium]|nr:hypothetical protein [Gammaproteobacteria bacterium]
MTATRARPRLAGMGAGLGRSGDGLDHLRGLLASELAGFHKFEDAVDFLAHVACLPTRTDDYNIRSFSIFSSFSRSIS